MRKIVSLKGLNKKPSITFGRLIARSPMWENQIKFQHGFFDLNARGYKLYPTDLDCLHCWGNTVASARNKVVKLALERKSDYLIFFDDDMTLESLVDDVEKMIDLDKDIVCGIGVTKGVPYWPNIAKVFKLGESGSICDVNIRKILDWPKDKPFQVDIAGGAFMCIKRKVLEKMTPPWFYMPPLYTEENIAGEDTTFCFNAKMHGFEVWVDPSIDLGHIGFWSYGVDHISGCFMQFKDKLLEDAKVQFEKHDKLKIENNDSTHNLIPEVQEVMKKGEGPKRMYV